MSSFGVDTGAEDAAASISPKRRVVVKQSIHSSGRSNNGRAMRVMSTNLPQQLTPMGVAFLSHIRSEVSKFCASKRLTEANIKDLDQKI